MTPEQNGRLFADGTFKWILLIEMFSISIIISVRFIPKGLIEKKKSVLIQIMAWHQTDNNPFCESMMAQVTYEVSWWSRRVFVWHCTLEMPLSLDTFNVNIEQYTAYFCEINHGPLAYIAYTQRWAIRECLLLLMWYDFRGVFVIPMMQSFDC